MSTSSSHSRASSKDSAASGASYQLILEHVFQKSGTYEIPLRTMYAINRSPGSHRNLKVNVETDNLPPLASPPSTAAAQRASLSPATAQFTSALIDHITSLPSQPCSLPTPLITTFLLRCFCETLALVDFPQALTGLDYLKDLETKRKRAINLAFTKLNVDKETLGAGSADQVPALSPPVAAWVKSVLDRERKVEALYTQLYIGLRRWILINELEQKPFNKFNCIAMLNTLYIPIELAACQPTPSLTPMIICKQREGFFKYIAAVEQSGPVVLETLMQQGKRPFDTNGWSAVRNTLDRYLRCANNLIDDCNQVNCMEDIERRQSVSSKRSKADSGISFGSNVSHDRRGSASESIEKGGRSSGPTSLEQIQPKLAPHNGSPMWQFSRGFSKLERIASEFRKIKTSRQQKNGAVLETSEANKENVNSDANQPQYDNTRVEQTTPQLKRPAEDSDVSKALEQDKKRENRGGAMRKLRSLGDLRSSASRSALRSQSRESSEARTGKPPAMEHFDAEEMRRKRMIWEANAHRDKEGKPSDEKQQKQHLETSQEAANRPRDILETFAAANTMPPSITITG